MKVLIHQAVLQSTNIHLRWCLGLINIEHRYDTLQIPICPIYNIYVCLFAIPNGTEVLMTAFQLTVNFRILFCDYFNID